MFVALNVRWRWAQGAAAAAPVDQAGTAPPPRPLTTPPQKKTQEVGWRPRGKGFSSVSRWVALNDIIPGAVRKRNRPK